MPEVSCQQISAKQTSKAANAHFQRSPPILDSVVIDLRIIIFRPLPDLAADGSVCRPHRNHLDALATINQEIDLQTTYCHSILRSHDCAFDESGTNIQLTINFSDSL